MPFSFFLYSCTLRTIELPPLPPFSSWRILYSIEKKLLRCCILLFIFYLGFNDTFCLLSCFTSTYGGCFLPWHTPKLPHEYPLEGLWRRVGRNERCYFLFLLLKTDLFHTIYIHYVLPSFYPPSSYTPSLVAGSTIFQSLLKRQAGIQEKTIKYSKIKEKQIH